MMTKLTLLELQSNGRLACFVFDNLSASNYRQQPITFAVQSAGVHSSNVLTSRSWLSILPGASRDIRLSVLFFATGQSFVRNKSYPVHARKAHGRMEHSSTDI
jgi:hypothetical protein